MSYTPVHPPESRRRPLEERGIPATFRAWLIRHLAQKLANRLAAGPQG